MSWIRWGSPCRFLEWPWLRWCHDGIEWCPGSSVYVFESGDDEVQCCCGDAGFTGTEKQMRLHLREHVERGQHVPRILYDDEVIARAEALWAALTPVERMTFTMMGMGQMRDMLDRRQQRMASAWTELMKNAKP